MLTSPPHFGLRFAIALSALVALSSCDDTGSKVKISSAAATSSALTGRASMFAPSSSSSSKNGSLALACSNAAVSLHGVTPSSTIDATEIATTTVDANGNFTFANVASKLSISTLNIKYILKVDGCGSTYYRPVTGLTGQNITGGSTLVGYAQDLLPSSGVKPLGQMTVAEVTSVAAAIDALNSTDLSSLLDNVIASTPVSSAFQSLTNVAPARLKEIPPPSVTVAGATSIQEATANNYGATILHWNQTYAAAYEWRLDGTLVSQSANYAYNTGGNDQGAHTLVLTIGTLNAGVLDQTKETKSQTIAITVANNILATPPALSLVAPTVVGPNPISTRAVTLGLATGAALVNCNSFSTLALTEETTSAPAASAFTTSCTSAGIQNLSYTLASSGDGAKTLRLWAKDSAGNISTAPSTLVVTLDTVAPSVSLTSSPGAFTNSASASFAYTGNDNLGVIDHYLCSTDGAAYVACSSPTAVSGLTEGAHTFAVEAFDVAQNVSLPATSSFIVDTTVPVLTIATTPNTITNLLTASFALSATDANAIAGFVCQIDGGGFTACTSPKTFSGLAAGTHTFQARAVDSASNQSSVQSYTWTIDTTPPTVTISSSPAALTSATTASFAFSGSDTGGGSIASYECALDAGSFAACTTPKSLTGLIEGSHTVRVRAIDTAGNTGTAATASWTVDTTAPVVTITSAAVPATNQTSMSFTFSATDTNTIAGSTCSIDGAAYVSCSSPKTYASLTEGSHTFNVKATDGAGNTSAAATRTWTIDTTAPVLTLTSTPNAVTNQTATSFAFSATDASGIASYSCTLDGATATCTSPTMNMLTAGTHAFSVTATDNVGNVSNIASYSWTIDTTPPTVSITSQPAATTNSQTGNFTFTGADTGGGSVASYQCSIDGAAYAACSSPNAYAALAAGAHTFGVKDTDTAGNVGTSATYAWTIDLTTPMASITANPPSITNATTASFTFSATPPAGGSITGYQCSLDGAAFATCTSPTAYSSLVQNSHTFQVRSVDNNSNTSSPSSYSWIIDTTNPTNTITSGPASLTNVTSATIAFTGADTGGGAVASFYCQIDGGAWGSCSTPVSYSSLTAGSHTFNLKNTDTAGNTSTTTARTWTIDLTAPTLTITSSPAAVTASTTGAVAFSATDANGVSGYTCSLDGAAYGACTSPVSSTGLTDGSHSFAVKATDGAGNTSAVVSASWIVDTTAPTLTLSSAPSGVVGTTSASFTFSATDANGVGGYTCSLDGAAYAACTSVKTVTGLTQGAHTFGVKATDSVGNVSAAQTASWTLDTTAPTVTITSAPAALNNSTSVSIPFSATDTGGGTVATYQCSIDAGSYATCSSPYSASSLAQGSHTFNVKATDSVGNTSAAVSATWTTDLTGPTTTITTNPGLITNSSSASFAFSATDTGGGAVASYQCSLDAAAYATCTSPNAPSSLAAGSHTFAVKALDTAGNTGSAATYSWTIDQTPPTVSITAQPALLSNTAAPSFSFSGADTGGGSVASYQCSLDAAAYTTCTSPKAYSSLAEGSHTFNVKSIDTATNSSTAATYTWSIDVTPPTVTITTPSASGTVVPVASVSAFTVSGACSENTRTVTIAGSIAATPTCSSGTWTTTLNLSALGDGTLSITATLSDASGNSTTSPARTFVKDTVAPTVALTSFNSGIFQGGVSQPLTWSSSDTVGLATNPIALDYSSDGGTTWTAIVSANANAGTYAWTTPALNSTTIKVRVRSTDQAGNVGTAVSTSNFSLDANKPVLSAMSVSGSTSVTNNNVPMNITATDNNKITHFCFQYNTTNQPALSDACWISVTSAGVTAGPSISIANYYYRIGFVAGTYVINGWIRDEAGNVSALTSTAGVDTTTVTYSPGSPPTMTRVLGSSTNTPSTPPVSTDVTATSGSTVYIFWQAADGAALPSNAIDLSYTTNDTAFTTIVTGLPNAAGTGCTLFGTYTGCYKWTSGSPTSTYYKIQAKVTNASSFSALNLSPSMNATQINILAGNSNVGTGASATSGVFLSVPQSDVREGDSNSFVIHPNGSIYFRDTSRGILKVDPSTGVTSIFLLQNGTLAGNGVDVATATASNIVGIALDKNNDLLVYDSNRIRRVTLSTSPAVISTIIGGGASTADSVALGTGLSMSGTSGSNSSYNMMFALANGDILFRTEVSGSVVPRLRWWHAIDSSVTTVNFTGTGLFTGAGATVDASSCTGERRVAPVVDNTGTLTAFIAYFYASQNTTVNPCNFDSSGHFSEGLFSTTGVFQQIVSGGGNLTYIAGRDGSLYRYSRGSYFQKFDSTAKTWTSQNVSGSLPCADGATFSTCQSPYDDIFIDLSGKLSVADHGRVRTVTDSGTLLTLAGQSLSYGDGLSPDQARFGTITSLDLWNDGTQDRVVVFDTKEHYFREFNLGSSPTVSLVAGNGISGTPSTTTLANVNPIFDVYSNSIQTGFSLDPSGNITTSSGPAVLGRMTRSTGKWSTIAGGGSTNFYSAAEGATGTSVKFLMNNSMVSVVTGGGGQTLFSMFEQSGTLRNRPGFKMIDFTNFNYTSLTTSTATSVSGSTWCASGTALSNCEVPLVSSTRTPAAYDATTASWYVANNSDGSVNKLTPGGNLQSYFTASGVTTMAYQRVSATVENFYTCNNSVIKKTTLTNGAVTLSVNLFWPIASLTCTGRNMIFSTSRNSIIFPFAQNGLNGVAEYPNP